MLRKLMPVVALTLAAAACGSDGGGKKDDDVEVTQPDSGLDGSTPSGNKPDGSTEGEPDATTNSGEADASPADGSAPDGGSPDAALPSISVTVRRLGVPVVDVPVLFHNATGAVTSEPKTNASGRVESTNIPTSITVVATGEAPVTRSLVTVTSVAAGDNLVVDLPSPAGDQRPGYLVKVPHPTAGKGSVGIIVFGGFNGCAQASAANTAGSSPITIALRWPVGCDVGSSTTLIAMAVNNQSEPTEYSILKNAAAQAEAAVNVDMPAWVASDAVNLSISNLPTTTVAANGAGRARIVPWSGGVPFNDLSFYYGQLIWNGSASTASGTIAVPHELASAFTATASIINRVTPSRPYYSNVARSVPASASIAVDFSANALGAPSAVARAGAKYTWTKGATNAAAADATVVTLFWEPTASTTELWTLIVPPNVESIDVPSTGTQTAPSGGAAAEYVSVSHFGNSTQDGYRGFLTEPLQQIIPDPQSDLLHPLMRKWPAEGVQQSTTVGPFVAP